MSIRQEQEVIRHMFAIRADLESIGWNLNAHEEGIAVWIAGGSHYVFETLHQCEAFMKGLFEGRIEADAKGEQK